MKIVIFGLSVSSSWGNGHATLWRGLLRALRRRGHRVVFFERDTPYYAAHRDPPDVCGCELVLFSDWAGVAFRAGEELDDADAAIVTSFCPDGPRALELASSGRVPLRVFYDLDTPVTLEKIHAGEDVPYLGPGGYADYDFILSFTGGRSLIEAQSLLGARAAHPLYGSVDPEIHRPAPARDEYRGALSYIGTFSADRLDGVEQFFFEPARRLRDETFVLAGPLYPRHLQMTANVRHFAHVAPGEHASFYASSALTLNVTRGVMKRYGYCPSGRLFEAAACGAPILSDRFEGLHEFFEPGREVLIADSTEEVMDALRTSPEFLRHMAERARERVLAEHTAETRARELEGLLAGAGRVAAEAS